MRIKERLGISSVVRSTKPLMWIHAASVGESRIALTLARYLNKYYPSYRVLITTGTLTSANIIKNFTSGKIVHQFLPMDNWISIWMFFNHWKPDIGILVESELWPNLINIGAKYCPLILVNARMSDRSLTKWKKIRWIAKMILNKFKYVLCQSSIDTKKYKSLGVNAIFIGNLKYSTNPLEINQSHLIALKKMIKERPVFLAASTHTGDEEIIAEAHIKLKAKYPNILTIIAPRHVIRWQEIKQIIEEQNLVCAVRSHKASIDDKTDIYIADTMSELSMLFTIAKVSFIGGSFKNGGHNPIEAAYFDTHIIFGPNMENFVEIADEFLRYKAATQIKNIDELVEIIDKILAGHIKSTHEETNIILTNHANILKKYWNYIEPYLAKTNAK